jgi:hypothetical protein
MITFLSQVWEDMGYIRWPLTFSFFVILALAVVLVPRLFRRGASPAPGTKSWIDAILFWGGFAALTGILGTLIGLAVGAHQLESGLEVDTSMLWGGLKVAVTDSVIGVLILWGSALLWFGLRARWRSLEASSG